MKHGQTLKEIWGTMESSGGDRKAGIAGLGGNQVLPLDSLGTCAMMIINSFFQHKQRGQSPRN